MGAAAVFETAAETPPTVDKELVAARKDEFFQDGAQLSFGGHWHPKSMANVRDACTYSRNRRRSPTETLATDATTVSESCGAEPPSDETHQQQPGDHPKCRRMER